MSKIIATIKLAPGKVAFFDEFTRIHLTVSNPTANVYEGMNLKRIKTSVKSGTLCVISGSLSEVAKTESAPAVSIPVIKAEITKQEDTVASETPVEVIENTTSEDTAVEKVLIEDTETPVEETPVVATASTKKTRKKSTTATEPTDKVAE